MTYDPSIRANGIGASDIPAILGLSPFKDSGPWSVALRKMYPELVQKVTMPTPMQRIGYALENELVFLAGGRLNDEPIWSEAIPWAYATPDGIHNEHGGPVECKVVGMSMAKHWTLGDSGPSGIPDHVRLQVAWQLMVLDKSEAVVSAYVLGSWELYTVPRHAGLEANMLKAASAFRKAAMLGEVSLALDGSEACIKLLREMSPPPPEKPGASTSDQRTRFYVYEAACLALKRARAEKATALAELLSVLPSGHAVVIPEGVLTNHKTGPKVSKVRT